MTTTNTHPDAQLLRRIHNEADAQTDTQATPTTGDEAREFLRVAVGELVDPDALYEVSLERSHAWLHDLSPFELLGAAPSVLQAAYMDAFLTGARFARERGERQ